MLKIRLRRMGKRHSPFYRVVVSDSRRTPTASSVEEVGHYNPRPTPPEVTLDLDRVRYWVEQGALLSPTVKRLVDKAASGKFDAPAEPPAKPRARKAAAAPPAAEAPAAEETAEAAAPAAAPAAAQAAAAEPAAEAAAEEAPAAEAAEAAEEKPAAGGEAAGGSEESG